MKNNKNPNSLAITYLGRALILIIISATVCILALLHYNSHISISDNEIEFEATTSNVSNDI